MCNFKTHSKRITCEPRSTSTNLDIKESTRFDIDDRHTLRDKDLLAIEHDSVECCDVFEHCTIRENNTFRMVKTIYFCHFFPFFHQNVQMKMSNDGDNVEIFTATNEMDVKQSSSLSSPKSCDEDTERCVLCDVSPCQNFVTLSDVNVMCLLCFSKTLKHERRGNCESKKFKCPFPCEWKGHVQNWNEHILTECDSFMTNCKNCNKPKKLKRLKKESITCCH